MSHLRRLVNLAIGSPGVKFKKSAMPFVQMENISHFLRACKSQPLGMQDHDMFLTVDLFEKKDPAQVLQCIGAFSRAANAANPSTFPSAIGVMAPPRSFVSPDNTGRETPSRNRGLSNASRGSRPGLTPTKTGDSASGRWSPAKSPTSDPPLSPGVTSWSKKNHEGVTSPAWNIAQYGYMGGASQGNLGIVYGGRRQITNAGPDVPSLRKKEQEVEAKRQKAQMEEEQRRRRAEDEAEQARLEEEQARLAEARRWEEQTAQMRAEEKRKADEEKRRWEEEERQWRLTEEKRRKEEDEAEERLAEERRRAKSQSNARLQGQFLSQYQAEQGKGSQEPGSEAYIDRIQQLEQQLELARQREREYEEERQRRSYRRGESKGRHRSRSRPNKDRPERPPSRQDSWSRNDREILHTKTEQPQEANLTVPRRPLPIPQGAPAKSSPLRPQRTGESRPLPVPGQHPVSSRNVTPNPIPSPNLPPRPLPTPSPGPTVPSPSLPPRKSPAPAPAPALSPRTVNFTAPATASARQPPPTKPKKSLLEREMEFERQRQREWEEAQQETAAVAAAQNGEGVEVDGVGGRWDVSQWSGYTGGDSQNRGGQGIGAGRRQIVGPRPLPGRP